MGRGGCKRCTRALQNSHPGRIEPIADSPKPTKQTVEIASRIILDSPESSTHKEHLLSPLDKQEGQEYKKEGGWEGVWQEENGSQERLRIRSPHEMRRG